MTESKIPFINLHCHDTFSVNDGFGFPMDFMKAAHANGQEAIAITNHGNQNSLSYQVEAHLKLKKENINVKPIFGVEAYYIDSFTEWQKLYQEYLEEKGHKDDKDELAGTIVNTDDMGKAGSMFKNKINWRAHIVLLAQSPKGLKNLFKIISSSYRPGNFYRFPRIDYELIKNNSEGLIGLGACLSGIYAKDYFRNRDDGDEAVMNAMRETTNKMFAIFGKDRWYGELQWNAFPEQHTINQKLIQLSKETGLKLVSTCDAHYARKELWKDRLLYKKLGFLSEKADFSLPSGVDELECELYPRSGDELWEAYKSYSARAGIVYDDTVIFESIKTAYDIGISKIESFLPDTSTKLPKVQLPAGKSAETVLSEMAVAGLKAKKLNKKPEYVKRLMHELLIIQKRGFSNYFLTMKTIVDLAKERMLVGPGRGSAAGSLLSYVLGITSVDPIRWGLMFERFLTLPDNPDEYLGYPDIDFDSSNNSLLKEMCREKWGSNSVISISNFNTLKLKSLVKDISKFYHIDFSETNAVTSQMMLEATPKAKEVHGIKSGVYDPTYQEVLEYSPSLQRYFKSYPLLKDHVEQLIGQIRTVAKHAAGVIITDNADENMPLIVARGEVQTPWAEGLNVRHLEPFGFIKFDLLGLATLAMFERTIHLILKKQRGIDPTFDEIRKFYNENLDPDVIDFNDKAVWTDVFVNPRKMAAGIFQFSSQGAQAFCRNVNPTTIEELSNISAIYRPGPLSSGVDISYLEAKKEPERVQYLHPIIKQTLEKTYGMCIYQENIAALTCALGKNISLNEGNQLRKLLIKKGTDKGIEKKESIYNRFIEGCAEKGITKEQSDDMWKSMESFNKYGFCAGHSTSYTIISYICAHLMHYYPDEWIVAFLDNEPEDNKSQAIGAAMALGYTIEEADLNNSDGYHWAVSPAKPKTLIQPLVIIKGLGGKAIEEIIAHRPFNTVEELIFHEEISYQKLNKKALDVLIRSSTLSGLMDDRFVGAKHFWSCVAVDRPKTKKKLLENIETYKPEGEFTLEEVIEFKTELLGIYPVELAVGKRTLKTLSDNFVCPLSVHDEILETCWFIVKEFNWRKTKENKYYCILDVVDSTGQINSIKCWGTDPSVNNFLIHRAYYAKKIDFSEQWGYSARNIKKNFVLLERK